MQFLLARRPREVREIDAVIEISTDDVGACQFVCGTTTFVPLAPSFQTTIG